MDILAGFLGHDVRIHREFYRLPQDVMQVSALQYLLFSHEIHIHYSSIITQYAVVMGRLPGFEKHIVTVFCQGRDEYVA